MSDTDTAWAEAGWRDGYCFDTGYCVVEEWEILTHVVEWPRDGWIWEAQKAGYCGA